MLDSDIALDQAKIGKNALIDISSEVRTNS